MVRSYTDEPVDPAVVARALDNATRAPSAGFSQGWGFLVLQEQADRDLYWSSTTEGDLGDARTTCWENLDKKLMEQVVPWVPYLWPNNVFIIGPTVTHWNYDQFTDGPAFSSVSVK